MMRLPMSFVVWFLSRTDKSTRVIIWVITTKLFSRPQKTQMRRRCFFLDLFLVGQKNIISHFCYFSFSILCFMAASWRRGLLASFVQSLPWLISLLFCHSRVIWLCWCGIRNLAFSQSPCRCWSCIILVPCCSSWRSICGWWVPIHLNLLLLTQSVAGEGFAVQKKSSGVFPSIYWLGHLLLVALPTRFGCWVGDLPAHDWHHLSGFLGTRNFSWTEAIYLREESVRLDDRLSLGNREVWGIRNALDLVFTGLTNSHVRIDDNKKFQSVNLAGM